MNIYKKNIRIAVIPLSANPLKGLATPLCDDAIDYYAPLTDKMLQRRYSLPNLSQKIKTMRMPRGVLFFHTSYNSHTYCNNHAEKRKT